MGWERRKGRLFYYRKEWNAGRVRSLYLGRGQKAIEASLADGVPVPEEVVLGAKSQEIREQEKAETLSEMFEKEPKMYPGQWAKFAPPKNKEMTYKYPLVFDRKI